MRTISELRGKIAAIPSLFAAGADSGAISGSEGSPDGMNFTNGFPRAYSQDPGSPVSDGRYIQRNDVNRFGEIASREAVFRESGGIHTFQRKVADDFSGYPKSAILSAYDGLYLDKVESTENGNKKAFAEYSSADADQEEIPLVIPDVIDCPVNDDDDSSSDEAFPKRVLWKSVGYVYGSAEGLFHLELDYTRARKLTDGDVITEDSLVVGYDLTFMTAVGSGSESAGLLWPMTYETRISNEDGNSVLWYINNKGRCGSVSGYYPYIYVALINGKVVFGFLYCPVIWSTGGTGNFALSFFAKKGTSFSGISHIYAQKIDGKPVESSDMLMYKDSEDDNFDRYVNWVAIPIVPRAKERDES